MTIKWVSIQMAKERNNKSGRNMNIFKAIKGLSEPPNIKVL